MQYNKNKSDSEKVEEKVRSRTIDVWTIPEKVKSRYRVAIYSRVTSAGGCGCRSIRCNSNISVLGLRVRFKAGAIDQLHFQGAPARFHRGRCHSNWPCKFMDACWTLAGPPRLNRADMDRKGSRRRGGSASSASRGAPQTAPPKGALGADGARPFPLRAFSPRPHIVCSVREIHPVERDCLPCAPLTRTARTAPVGGVSYV
jgi:hypothetical protein